MRRFYMINDEIACRDENEKCMYFFLFLLIFCFLFRGEGE